MTDPKLTRRNLLTSGAAMLAAGAAGLLRRSPLLAHTRANRSSPEPNAGARIQSLQRRS